MFALSAIRKVLTWIPGKFRKHLLLLMILFPGEGSLFERRFVGLIFQKLNLQW
jgi:hypothetical protein